MSLLSMTGYGRSAGEGPWTVEIRSVNHRFLDLRLRMPHPLAPLEDRIRALVRGGVARGHVELFISSSEGENVGKQLHVDTDLASAYYNALKELSRRLQLPDSITLDRVASLPDVFYFREQAVDPETVWRELEPAVRSALEALAASRRFEGERLERDCRQRLDRLRALLREIEARAPVVAETYRTSLERRLQELLEGRLPDPGRLREEILFFAERSDIHEELARFRSHLDQVEHALDAREPVGRRLDFLLQELHRELNTTAAKANDAVIAERVVEAKVELEKLREQVQNVE